MLRFAHSALLPNVSATPIVKDYNDDSAAAPLNDSTAILQKYLGDELYPSPEVFEVEEDIDLRLGPTARVFAYHHLLKKEHTNLMIDVATKDTSTVESLIFKQLATRNMIQPGMKKFMHISEESSKISEVSDTS